LDKKILILAILGILGIVAVSGCTGYNNPTNNSSTGNSSNSSMNMPNMVTIQNFAFSPATTTVKAGTKVTWTNQDSTTHHVVSDTGAFDSGNLNSGQSYSFTFNKTGSYPYHCSIHPSMTGTIIVQ
jgi:plastocyanin